VPASRPPPATGGDRPVFNTTRKARPCFLKGSGIKIVCARPYNSGNNRERLNQGCPHIRETTEKVTVGSCVPAATRYRDGRDSTKSDITVESRSGVTPGLGNSYTNIQTIIWGSAKKRNSGSNSYTNIQTFIWGSAKKGNSGHGSRVAVVSPRDHSKRQRLDNPNAEGTRTMPGAQRTEMPVRGRIRKADADV
jgi:hypothetical protein